MLLDMLDRPIQVGDIVLYTAPGLREKLPPLTFGKVVKLTKAGVTVQRLEKDYTPVQKDDGYMRGTGRFWTSSYSGQQEIQEFVKTGKIDADPVNIRYYKDRFYIMETP